MAAASTTKSAQHALESLVLGTLSGGATPSAGGAVLVKQQVTATIPTAAVSITGVVTATVNGAALGDLVLCSRTTGPITGEGAYGAYVSAADTITLWAIATTGGYTGASKVYNIIVLKQS